MRRCLAPRPISCELPFDRRWGALLTGVVLLLWLLPWYRLVGGDRFLHLQMIGVLLVAIVAYQLGLLQSSTAPYDLLPVNERFQLQIGWDIVDVNNVHALGSLFVTVVLASWHYGVDGVAATRRISQALPHCRVRSKTRQQHHPQAAGQRGTQAVLAALRRGLVDL